MKKIMMLLGLAVFTFTLVGCFPEDENNDENVEELYVLNWGEYMDPELVEAFEDEYNVKVYYQEVGSNEEMEAKILSGTATYDIALPSDYMIDKLRQQNLLHEIDTDLLPALNDVSIRTQVSDLYSDKAYAPYMVPYFWGTIGIMYNTDNVDVNDLTSFMDLFTLGTQYKIGMYDSSRDAVASALLALDLDVNTADEAELLLAENLLKDATFEIFGEDNLKLQIIQGNLDMALVYSGDYFDELYVAEEEELDINFGYFVPEKTNIWVDAFVIPTTAQNTDLAHAFINYFLQEAVAEQNADWVGYAPVIEEVYTTLTDPDGDYGYDYDNYNPYPEGSDRVLYEFVSDDRFARLNEILNNAKLD